MGRKAVFLDRDGTINRDVHYLDSPEKLEVYPSVAPGIRALNLAGFLVVIVTNQSGLARGLFNIETLNNIHEELERELNSCNARIDAIFYCPHHPDDGCSCRKPGTALLERAILEFGIDAAKSFFVGDRITDVEAGNRIGCRTILVPESIGLVEKEKATSEVRPDFECSDFREGVEWILRSGGY